MISATPIPPRVPSINARNTSSTSILAEWKETTDALGYIVTLTKAEDAKLDFVQVNTSNLSYEIKRLSKYTWYNVTVQAFNQYGMGPVSEPVSCRTDEDGMRT